MTAISSGGVDPGNIQGLVLQPYRYKLARYLLFGFPTDSGAKGFLRALLPRLTRGGASLNGSLPLLVNVALTYSGLKKLGQSSDFLGSLDPMLEEGPSGVSLGDVSGSESDPINWWEQQFDTAAIHCMVQIFSRELATLENGTADVGTLAEQFGLQELVPHRNRTRLDGQAIAGGKVHFGYKDGISQPNVCWKDAPLGPGQLHYRHFLLGYATPDVYSSPGSGPVAEILRDSSYAVLRWIYQDVSSFNRFLENQGPALAPHLPPADAQELLAAKLVGRWRDGTPLVLSPNRSDEVLANSDAFSFLTQDPNGFKCPFSAHIRICNPRDQALGAAQAGDGIPRIIRRGIPYGPPMDCLKTEDDGVDRGLLGFFICSSIRRQFYTLTRWISENSFSPVFGTNRHTQDPLFGNPHYQGAVNAFMIPAESHPVTLNGLPEFVHTKGTAFFLLPSLSALDYLSGG